MDVDDLETQKRLVAEAERLLDYAKKGDIEKQEIPVDILKSAVIIRSDLREKGEYANRVK